MTECFFCSTNLPAEGTDQYVDEVVLLTEDILFIGHNTHSFAREDIDPNTGVGTFEKAGWCNLECFVASVISHVRETQRP